LPQDGDSSLRLEAETLAKIFETLRMSDTSLRRAARASLADTKRARNPAQEIGPSEATAEVVSYATRLAQENTGGVVSLAHLLDALLECPSSPAPEFFKACRLDVGSFTAAVRNALAVKPVLSKASDSGAAGLNGASAAQADDIAVGQTIAIDNTPPPIALVENTRTRMALLCELPLDFAKQGSVESLLQTIVEKLIAVIPGAVRGALLLRDGPNGKLLLKAHLPAGRHAVSLTLAQRAMDQREGFIWHKGRGQDLNASIQELRSLSGMYAPLVWCDEALGVLCVDNPDSVEPFNEDDLRLLIAVARYAALAVANVNLQQQLRQNATLLVRLLTNFSPKLRESLLAKARQGKLRLGGEKSEVTILCADIRGFTRLTADMDAQEVMDLLNSYFPALVESVFRFNGTVDKFIGDAILAVFGSPEPDPAQCENAIRAAADMQAAMASINAERARRGQTTCAIGIGIHCGEVLHGFIGSPERTEFTVIGDAVNKASRYCDGAQASEILISPKLYEQTWRIIEADSWAMPTKHEGNLCAYRVMSVKSK
jgi:adenylate cyclase